MNIKEKLEISKKALDKITIETNAAWAVFEISNAKLVDATEAYEALDLENDDDGFLDRLEDACSKIEAENDEANTKRLRERQDELELIVDKASIDVVDTRFNFNESCEIRDSIGISVENMDAYSAACDDCKEACITYTSAWDKHEDAKEALSIFNEEYRWLNY